MKIIWAILLSSIIIGLGFVGYLYALSQSENVQNALLPWEIENRFKLCSRPNNVPLSMRILLSKSLRADVEVQLKGAAISDYFALGVRYIENEDERLNEEDAFSMGMHILEIAAQQGDAAAMNEIAASLLFCQQGVSQDMMEAKSWLEKAAAKNDEYSLYNLASLHLQNIDPFNNKSKALRYLRKSAGLGYDQSDLLLQVLSKRARLSKMELLSLKLRRKPTKSRNALITVALEEHLEKQSLGE